MAPVLWYRAENPHDSFGSVTLRKNTYRHARLALAGVIAVQVAGCGAPRGDWGEAGGPAPQTTYRKFLALAEAGNAESQNVVGFMLFHGEGVRMDRSRALKWFQSAAALGNPRAQRNLTIMQSESALEPGTVAARRLASVSLPLPGQSLYERYCAGCHGFNGISTYVHSPSFALGETLQKGDADLLHSMLRGKGEMPNWDDKFSYGDLAGVLQYVRTLRERYQQGVGGALRGAPPVFYLFGPMRPDQPASRELQRDYGD